MTAQNIHRERIEEHLSELRDAVALGLENRPATVGFHTSACAIDLLELYLHKTGKISIGMQVKHDWFKRPNAGQKSIPLAERKIKVDFEKKEEIIELLYDLEENRNVLIYGKATKERVRSSWDLFQKFKAILRELLLKEGVEIEDPNQ